MSQLGVPQNNIFVQNGSRCPTQCPTNACLDQVVRRHDTKPPFRVSITDCDGPLDLSDPTLVLEANMWSNARIKAPIGKCDTYFALSNNIGFDQVMVGDIIVMDRVRMPEHMLVIGFDETNKLIEVTRGYNGTNPSNWPKGNHMKIFRIMNAPAEISSVFQDVLGEDGIMKKSQLTDTYLIYEWASENTCLPGCFWFEFKLLKMMDISTDTIDTGGISMTPSLTPDPLSCIITSNIEFTPSNLLPSDFGCGKDVSIQWIRRFPTQGEGFLIKIEDSPTAEL